LSSLDLFCKEEVALDKRFSEVFRYEESIVKSIRGIEAAHGVLGRLTQLGVLLAYDLLDLGYGVAAGNQRLNHWNRLAFFFMEELVVIARDVFLVLRRETVIVFNVVLVHQLQLLLRVLYYLQLADSELFLLILILRVYDSA